ncbi:hypothetical protein [Pedobacter sp. SYSU D00535]|uniref:hypothetical protein n=1 Tax=Pedobacter sp. SYSU D00535 TaxID=2810308 RepID=UPI001A97D1B1|nr:hypothetical protein [Pedobacter sp. SYSU D00535]
MNPLLLGVLFCLWGLTGVGQDLKGKWYGKLTQDPGGYSDLYNFDLYLNQGKKLWGESDAYIDRIVKVKIRLEGKVLGDSVLLAEKLLGIEEERMPPGYITCIKTLRLKYLHAGSAEYLLGTWDGFDKLDYSPCPPGQIVLARSRSHLQQFFDGGGFGGAPLIATTTVPLPEFTPMFQETEIKKLSEIQVSKRELEFRLNDYLKEDNDTVSVYFNRNLIAGKQKISKKPFKFKLTIADGSGLNEVLLFAENLGHIPPNTSQLLIIDGNKTHRLLIESDKQKTAAVYLRYKP